MTNVPNGHQEWFSLGKIEEVYMHTLRASVKRGRKDLSTKKDYLSIGEKNLLEHGI